MKALRRVVFCVVGLGAAPWLIGAAESGATSTLVQARREFRTHLLRSESIGEPAETPPAGVLELVSYPAPLGRNAAYVSPRPADGKRRPAVIWLVGGFSNSIGAIAWTPGPRANDQSAAAFRAAGIVMMYPSLRGGNDNPGVREVFLGEVDDVLAAADYLASLDYVDPARIYLGGHSTGGTLALLVAEAAGDRFRAVFSLGPVNEIAGYGAEVLPFDLADRREVRLRSPGPWLQDIRCPTLICEGSRAPSNFGELVALRKRCANPLVQFIPMKGEDHFSEIAPVIEKLIARIAADGPPVATPTMDSR